MMVKFSSTNARSNYQKLNYTNFGLYKTIVLLQAYANAKLEFAQKLKIFVEKTISTKTNLNISCNFKNAHNYKTFN